MIRALHASRAAYHRVENWPDWWTDSTSFITGEWAWAPLTWRDQ